MYCEFCSREFSPRPQIKHPRACSAAGCQQKRQRSNETSWLARHRDDYKRSYYEIQKKLRMVVMGEFIKRLLDCLKVGARMTSMPLDFGAIELFLAPIIFKLGVRRTNKLWIH